MEGRLLSPLSSLSPQTQRESQENMNASSDDYLNGIQCEGKMGRRCQQKKCSKYCVPLITSMKVVLAALSTSPALSFCLVLVLSHFAFGSISGVEAEEWNMRGVEAHRHRHANWHSSSDGSRSNASGHFRRGGDQDNGSMTGSTENWNRIVTHHYGTRRPHRGPELSGLDKVLQRLEPAATAQQRDREDYASRDTSEQQKQVHEYQQRVNGDGQEKDQDDHHQSPILPSFTPTTTTPQSYYPPRGYQGNVIGSEGESDSDNETENGDDDEEEDEYDEDYENEEHDDNTHQSMKNSGKLSQWAENYKSRYLRDRDIPTTTTETPLPTTTSPVPSTTTASTYSQWKWKHLGTRQGLEQFRRQRLLAAAQTERTTPSLHHYHHTNRHGNSHLPISNHGQSSSAVSSQQTLIAEAIDHAMRIKQETECKTPRPRVVNVQDFYPNPSKFYIPHCTILHQCSDDTGCCKQPETCTPKRTQRVELAFFSNSIDQSKESIVERLVFYNHTECECRDKMDEMMPRDESYLVHHRHSYSSAASPTTRLDASTNVVKVDDRDKKKDSLCKCPSVFNRRLVSGNSCSCDCFDGQMDCLHLKHGRELFNVSDKLCIQFGRCEVPECAFGPYIHLLGRCPHKQELDHESHSWTKYLSP